MQKLIVYLKIQKMVYIMPFPQDTILRFYGYGKLATFKKLNGEPAFYLYNKETQEELMIDQMFYIPKGKMELEII